MEIQSWVRSPVESLTDELIAFRESSDAASRKVARLTRVLVGATDVLIILTGVLVWLTEVLAHIP
jgi:hypothetical protein